MTFIAGRNRWDSSDLSLVRTHAQSRSETESPRARVPFLPDTNLLLRQRYPRAYKPSTRSIFAPLTVPNAHVLQYRHVRLPHEVLGPVYRFASRPQISGHRDNPGRH